MGFVYESPTKDPITSPEQVADVFRSILMVEDTIAQNQEHFWVMHLNGRNQVQSIRLIGLGTALACLASPRELFRQAIIDGAISVIIGHNHPSGEASPSEEDVTVTRRVKEAGELLEIAVLDHVIVTQEGFASLKSMGAF